MEWGTTAFIYKRYNLTSLLQKVRNGWQGEREIESKTAKIYPRLRCDIFKEPYFFTRLVQGRLKTFSYFSFFVLPLRGWHKTDLKHLCFFFVLLSQVTEFVWLPWANTQTAWRPLSLLTAYRSLCWLCCSWLQTSVVIYFSNKWYIHNPEFVLNFEGFWDANGSSNLIQTTRPSDSQ